MLLTAFNYFYAVNLVIVNSTAMLTEGDGPAVVCVSIDAEIERSITVSISAMSVTATGTYIVQHV